MKNEPYIKLYKSLKDSTFWECESSEVIRTYMTLLFYCNYENHNYRGHMIYVGEWLGSKTNLASLSHTTRTTINKHLSILEKYGLVKIREVNSRGLWLITLKDYAEDKVFQMRQGTKGKQAEPKQEIKPVEDPLPPEKLKTNISTNSDDYYSQCEEVIIDGVKKYKGPDGEIWDM